MFKESLIVLYMVTVVWTQSCSPSPPGVATIGEVQYTHNAQWSGTILNSLPSVNRNCVSLVNPALSVRSFRVNYQCRLFSTSDCRTTHPHAFFANEAGWSNTGVPVLGITCPWSCTNNDAGDNGASNSTMIDRS